MENIDHIAKNSLDSIARNNLSEEGKKHIITDVITGAIGIAALVIGLIIGRAFPDRQTVRALIFTVGIAAPKAVTALRFLSPKTAPTPPRPAVLSFEKTQA